eukprot:TRINITY_DN3512_c0_g1_i1.p1 TRINITY_DN3512_c0_g1~~TRINITY_DN3512_c0_g1_i1.p1  ORF type:complete len:306 (-),score=82.84 TRINITY_DN3512_c0_g1_i1:40-957(-)
MIRWKEILDNFENEERSDIKTMIYKGIPEKLRPMAWIKLASLKQSFFSGKYKYDDNLVKRYSKIWEKMDQMDPEKNDYVRQIMLDTQRTYGEHYYFENDESEGRVRLARILKNYSFMRKDLGYCQGMNEIAATVLLVIDDDLVAFSIFSEIIDRLEGYFVKNLWELVEDCQLFEFILNKQFPHVLIHLKENDVEISMFFSKWVLSIFSFLKFEQHVKCIDYVLLEGIKAIYKIALSIFMCIEKKLMSLEGLDKLLPFLLSLHDDDTHIDIESVYPTIPIEDYLQVAPRFSLKKSLKRQHVRQTSR